MRGMAALDEVDELPPEVVLDEPPELPPEPVAESVEPLTTEALVRDAVAAAPLPLRATATEEG